jgi:hypothetical protein
LGKNKDKKYLIKIVSFQIKQRPKMKEKLLWTSLVAIAALFCLASSNDNSSAINRDGKGLKSFLSW